jgi:hypothetical protein
MSKIRIIVLETHDKLEAASRDPAMRFGREMRSRMSLPARSALP